MDNYYVNTLQSFTFITFILITLSGSTCAEKNSTFNNHLQKGITFLEKNNYDSAIAYFLKAYSAGLSQDSLFYFWSEVFLRKKVFDSSLAANFMVKGDHHGLFKLQILKQRQTIYSKLGWQKEASALLDTIYSLPEYHHLTLLPELDVKIFTGIGRRALTCDSSLPWGTGAGTYKYYYSDDWSGGVDLKSIWQRKHGKRSYSTGMSGSINRYPVEISNVKAIDSVDITGSVFGTITGKSMISSVNFMFNRRFDDRFFLGALVETGIVGSGNWVPILWSGASVYVTPDFAFSNARGWLFFSAQNYHKSIFKVNYQAFLNLLISPKDEFTRPKAISVLYAEDAQRQYPVFYTDQTYTTMIDTSYFRLISGQITKDVLASGTDSVVVSKLILPNSNLSFAPGISFTLISKFPVQIGFGWKLSCFLQPYQWDEISNDASYLIYSRADGAYHRITTNLTMTKGANGGIELSPAVEPGQFRQEHFSMYRVDNTVSADLSIQLFENKVGTGLIRTSVSKVWSTISGKVPVDIPAGWNFSAFIEWRFRTQNAINKI